LATWIGAPNRRTHSLDVLATDSKRQMPKSKIPLHFQSMAGSETPSEHLAAPPAFEANDIIAMNRSPDRDGGCPLSVEFGYRFTKACEGLIHGRDQRPELVRPDLVPPNVRGDNFSREFSIE
jgi:hypothetical protein